MRVADCHVPHTVDDKVPGGKTAIATDRDNMCAGGPSVARLAARTLGDAVLWPEVDKTGSVGGVDDADSFGNNDGVVLQDLDGVVACLHLAVGQQCINQVRETMRRSPQGFGARGWRT